ncbi:MAG: polymorphic toxin type 17 domain-containing protein, partial [Mycobacteriales bacterium]
GGYQDALGNVWTETAAKGRAAEQGYAHEWRVDLSDEGLAAWESAAKNGRVHVTPHGDISH